MCVFRHVTFSIIKIKIADFMKVDGKEMRLLSIWYKARLGKNEIRKVSYTVYKLNTRVFRDADHD